MKAKVGNFTQVLFSWGTRILFWVLFALMLVLVLLGVGEVNRVLFVPDGLEGYPFENRGYAYTSAITYSAVTIIWFSFNVQALFLSYLFYRLNSKFVGVLVLLFPIVLGFLIEGHYGSFS